MPILTFAGIQFVAVQLGPVFSKSQPSTDLKRRGEGHGRHVSARAHQVSSPRRHRRQQHRLQHLLHAPAEIGKSKAGSTPRTAAATGAFYSDVIYM